MSEALARLSRHPAVYTRIVEEDLFADGYCDCRCGPGHHRVWFDDVTDAVISYCQYHKRECGRVPGQKIRDWVEAAKVEATGRGFLT